MPKRKRVWYPGAVYHIMSRGNRRTKIFRDESDYRVYLKILDRTGFECRFQLYSYCLMPNHIHLQLETGEVEIWEIMRRINRGYACYFNRRHNLVGHLFQGRYKSKLIQDSLYNLQVNRYIHLNPVKAGLVKSPADYAWSSYSCYLSQERSELVNPEKILQYFWPDNSRGLDGTAGERAAAETGSRGAPNYPANIKQDYSKLKLARQAYQNYIESEPPEDESGIDAEIEKDLA